MTKRTNEHHTNSSNPYDCVTQNPSASLTDHQWLESSMSIDYNIQVALSTSSMFMVPTCEFEGKWLWLGRVQTSSCRNACSNTLTSPSPNGSSVGKIDLICQHPFGKAQIWWSGSTKCRISPSAHGRDTRQCSLYVREHKPDMQAG